MQIKFKTKKAAIKRIRIKTTHLSRKKAYKSHLLRKKNSKHLRRLSIPEKIHSADRASYYSLVPGNLASSKKTDCNKINIQGAIWYE